MLSFVLFPVMGIAIVLTPLVAVAGVSYARAADAQDDRPANLESLVPSSELSQ